MITLQSVQPLFQEEAPIPRELLKGQVVEDFKRTFLTGTADNEIEIDDSQWDEGGGIMVKAVTPHASAGYLDFQDQADYQGWLAQSLYQPTQDEIQEAMSGNRAG